MPRKPQPIRLQDWRSREGIFDEELSQLTAAVDPEGLGISERTLRRMRRDQRPTLRQAVLLHLVSQGQIPLTSLLDEEWILDAYERAQMEAPQNGP